MHGRSPAGYHSVVLLLNLIFSAVGGRERRSCHPMMSDLIVVCTTSSMAHKHTLHNCPILCMAGHLTLLRGSDNSSPQKPYRHKCTHDLQFDQCSPVIHQGGSLMHYTTGGTLTISNSRELRFSARNNHNLNLNPLLVYNTLQVCTSV